MIEAENIAISIPTAANLFPLLAEAGSLWSLRPQTSKKADIKNKILSITYFSFY
jgi:hypothetical protein